MKLKQEDRQKLDKIISTLLGKAMSAYVDCIIYLEAYDSSVTTRRETFVFKYTFYMLQQRLIIAVKKLIEPAKSDKITMFSIGKIIEAPNFCTDLQDKNGIKYIYTDRLNEVFNSEYAKRLKDMRDAFCHNVGCTDNKPMGYCKDFMNVLQDCLNTLLDVREQILNQRDINCQQIKDFTLRLAKDYWHTISAGAKDTTLTQTDLLFLDKITGNTGTQQI